jgi:hypothetical protein
MGGTWALRRRRRLHGRSMGRRKGAPDVGPPRRGLATRPLGEANGAGRLPCWGVLNAHAFARPWSALDLAGNAPMPPYGSGVRL